MAFSSKEVITLGFDPFPCGVGSKRKPLGTTGFGLFSVDMRKGHAEIVKKLLGAGAYPERALADGSTPVYIASWACLGDN